MPTICCAVGCKHTSGNGICRLKRFPSDVQRSIVWEKNLRRNNWVRKDWELLCECHFHFSQFEKLREDGAKKLKHNAVPTLFPTHTLPLPEISGTHLSSVETYPYPEVRIVNNCAGILEALVPVECNFDTYQFKSDFVDGENNLSQDTVPHMFSVRAIEQDEVHFEESAFESHRADGLKKLKPNAVPTIHSVSTSSRKQRKQNVKPRVEFTFGESDNESFVLAEKLSSKSNEGESIQISEVYCNKLEEMRTKPEKRKRLKTIHVTEIISNGIPVEVCDDEEGTQSIKLCSAVKDAENHVVEAVKNSVNVLPVDKPKRGRPLKKRRKGGDAIKHDSNIFQANAKDALRREEDQILNGDSSPESIREDLTVECFICNQVITPGYGVCLNIPTEATHILLVRRLEIIANLEGVLGSQEVVCSRCASLLNHVDRTEAELSVLKGAIAACTRGRNIDGKLEDDPEYANNVQLLDRFESLNGGRHNILSLDELFLIKGENEEMMENLVEDRSEEEQAVDRGVEDGILDSGETAEADKQLPDAEEDSDTSPAADELDSVCMDECSNSELKRIMHMSNPQGDIRTTEEPLAKKAVPYASTKEKSSPSCSILPHETTTHSKTHVCKICSFKTPHDCVMIWHLRMHMKEGRWCDFCSIPISEQESIFFSMKKSRAPNKVPRKKPSPKAIQPKILPAPPLKPLTLSPYPISPPYSLTFIPIENGKASAPVLLISKESDSVQEVIGDSTPVVDSPKNLEMVDVMVDGGMLESSMLPGESNVPKDGAKFRNKMKEHANGVPSVEEFCGVQESTSERLEGENSVGTLGDEFDVSINECDNLVGGAVMQDFGSLAGQGGDMAGECVSRSVSGFVDDGSQGSKSDNLHNGEVFCDDSVEHSFLDTLSSQPEGKFPEILPEICDESGEQNMMAISNDASEGNITNKDVSFARSDGLGESELAIAYENSVAALMCQSDDSDGLLSYH